MKETGVFQVVMLDVMKPGFEQWLASRRHVMFYMPEEAQDGEIPCYGIAPSQELWEEVHGG